MENINELILKLVDYGAKNGLIGEEDRAYSVNRILSVLKLNGIDETAECGEPINIPSEALEPMLDWAFENGLLESNTPVYRDLLDTEIMACLMPRPVRLSVNTTLFITKIKRALPIGITAFPRRPTISDRIE